MKSYLGSYSYVQGFKALEFSRVAFFWGVLCLSYLGSAYFGKDVEICNL